ncbi:hypothetical protein Tdes44962_MAKER04299, partial [Teratosphaeria destructans]
GESEWCYDSRTTLLLSISSPSLIIIILIIDPIQQLAAPDTTTTAATMTSTGNLWWMTPLQAFATLGAAANFGGSALQSPLIMPMLQMSQVPTHHAGTQTAYLLHHSEKFFPPLNMLCTLSNLAVTVGAYLNRNKSSLAAERLPYVATAFAGSVATTAYALLIMVPMNRRMTALSKNLEVNNSDEKSEKEFRSLQSRWQKLNLGRATIMISSAVVGMYALLLDGATVRL